MKNFRLWITFIVTIVMTGIAGFFFTGILAFTCYRLNLLRPFEPAIWLTLIGFIIAAAVISMTLTILASRRIFRPVHTLALALNEVASGNFRIQLNETGEETAIREMNRNFNKMVRELNSIELVQSDFIQNVSHEFKTPLAAMEGYASLLISSPIPEEQKDYARRILESSRQLSALTSNILKLSKLENQQIVSEKTSFSLDEQLRQVILTMEPLWGEKDLNLELELPEVKYTGNEDLIGQVWINLLSNAIKFTPAGGVICVVLRESEDSVTVIFRDTGIGMTEDVKAHIFEKFYQGDKSRSSRGNGLGLALVKKILSLCGGEILVESAPGCGSEFTVRLPKHV